MVTPVQSNSSQYHLSAHNLGLDTFSHAKLLKAKSSSGQQNHDSVVLAKMIGDIFVDAALAAGRVILAHYDQRTPVGGKKDGSPVSFADEEAERIILQRLAAQLPQYPVIAEEAIARGHMPQIGADFILVDPLDGTREFIAHNDAFTVNLALIENGVATVGVIYAPAAGKLWRAAVECDLLQIEEARAALPLIKAIRRLSCGSGADIEAHKNQARQKDGLIALRSRLHFDQRTEQFLAQLPISRQIDFGSSLKFCAIAEGLGDVYPRFSPTMEWDVAAGDAILRAAGGCVLTSDGQPLTYGKQQDSFRNPAFVAWASQELYQQFGAQERNSP